MPTPVPAVDRAADILGVMAEAPLRSFSLTEIAQLAGTHKATTSSILARLVTVRLVRRVDGKRYVLGPELVRLGSCYADRHPAYHAARREMFRLADRLGLSVSLCVQDADDLVILDMAGDIRPSHLPQRIGRRIPAAPPLGTVFRVWDEPHEIEAWLSEMAEEYELDRAQQLRAISTIRTRGYSLGSEEDFDIQLETVLRRLTEEGLDERSVGVAMMLADKLRTSHPTDGSPVDDPIVNYILAPVFGPNHRVVMSVQVFGAPGQIRRAEVPGIAAVLLEGTTRISEQIGGSPPMIAHHLVARGSRAVRGSMA